MTMSNITRRDFLKSTGGAALGSALLAGGSSRLLAADPYAGATLKSGPPPLPQKDAFTVIALPDTQVYALANPEGYIAQTQWILDQQKRRNIACVLHLGDITNNNRADQWKLAQRAMTMLDGHVPYFMALGNHDYSEGGRASDRSTHFHEYFPLAKYSALPSFGGNYDKEPERFDNSYHYFSAGGRDFLVLALEFGPRDDVVRWANEVIEQHPDRSAILITHAFVYYNDTRYNWEKYGGKQNWNPHAYPVAENTDQDVNDGQELWDKLISRHDNFIMTLNGHVLGDGLGQVVTELPGKASLPQILVNYQMKPHGGDGWLRLLEFRPDQTVASFDYSPTRNECNVSPESEFEVRIRG